jgi:hypothetical protein
MPEAGSREPSRAAVEARIVRRYRRGPIEMRRKLYSIRILVGFSSAPTHDD